MSTTTEPTPVVDEKPAVAAPPAKHLFTEIPPIPTRRAFAPDITQMEEWLFPRLLTIYPNSTFVGLRSALMHASVSNEQFVVRTANAIAAVRAVPENLTGVPYAKVWFALAKHGAEDAEEIAELHKAMVDWMRRSGMEVMLLSPHMDCDRSYVRSRIGRLTKHEVYAWHLNLQAGKSD